ncbi:peptidoglycan DD-metalloendopeptidase family protein [Paenibacillus xerothermodurans]|uniref:M23 family peptidase n=1 Tax=Paenibacillus xerothermodurans TaxID=1977292 RepID=A0A2W1N6G9_PAEXE|nr:peptidoglycan DD-metalloendopeptidase family protein [Paenibacillus xerothermodurans]PZE19977.1 M23 family peptidase [Paenibacillus xerothermodurans]
MEKRDKLRQRRMERIRHLSQFGNGEHVMPPANRENHSPNLPDAPARPRTQEPASHGSDDEPWNDPEHLWRLKWNREMARHSTHYEDQDHEQSFIPTKSSIRIKLFISCVLFALIWAMFQSDHPLANKGKAFVTATLNESFDFRPVAAWYERQFGGAPTLLPALNPVNQQEAQKVTADSKHYFAPVRGKVIAPFEPGTLGVTVETKADATVSAMDTGLVVYAGAKEDTGFTVIVRHTDGVQSVYGWIEKGRVSVNDWIKGGETLGSVSQDSSQQTGYVYFAVSKDNTFINPADVVNFD